MNTPNDGGFAFPVPMFPRMADGQPMSAAEFGLGGMSLRDYFAGQALVGWLASFGPEDLHPAATREHAKSVALYSYAIADAMLEARNNGGKA